MKPTYLFILIFSFSLFSSFASENNSEILPKKKVSEIKSNSIQSKKQKLNFKEKIALKLIEKKIKKKYSKTIKNTEKNNNSIKMDDTIFTLIEIGVLSLVLTSIILSIVSFFSGNVLVGILLLLIAALLALLFIGFLLENDEGHVMLKDSDSTLN